jgi:hypothetical protein
VSGHHAQRRAWPRSLTKRWRLERTGRVGNTVPTSGHADVAQRCLAKGDQTLRAPGHS